MSGNDFLALLHDACNQVNHRLSQRYRNMNSGDLQTMALFQSELEQTLGKQITEKETNEKKI